MTKQDSEFPWWYLAAIGAICLLWIVMILAHR